MLILASASEWRKRLLVEAGVVFHVQPSFVDEDRIRASLRQEGVPPGDWSDALAEIKAQKIARIHSMNSDENFFVLGCDQTLLCEGKVFEKPCTIAKARQQLQFLRAKRHCLICAVVIANATGVLWRAKSKADIWMRNFSDDFLEQYLCDIEHDGSLSCPAGCKIEGRGAQLLTRIEGDLYTIYGLCLLQILDFLRLHGILGR